MNKANNKCIIVRNNHSASTLWRFVESKVKNPLGTSQYSIHMCDTNGYVLTWSDDFQYDQHRNYIMVNKENVEVDHNSPALWIMVPRKQTAASGDASELFYEILDAGTGEFNLYAAQIYEQKTQLALLWRYNPANTWIGVEDEKRQWKFEPIKKSKSTIYYINYAIKTK